jgi:8-oxo-dGTP diphosphatase
MVGAFLTYNNKVLLIHRSETKKLAPGMWSCIGGHMEPNELNSPLETCYREVEEETGISKELLSNLQLKYITIRNTGDEIRSGYYFIGSMTNDYGLSDCNEGTLHWVDLAEVSKKPMTFSIKQITTHWLSNSTDDSIYLCGINRENNKNTWVKL